MKLWWLMAAKCDPSVEKSCPHLMRGSVFRHDPGPGNRDFNITLASPLTLWIKGEGKGRLNSFIKSLIGSLSSSVSRTAAAQLNWIYRDLHWSWYRPLDGAMTWAVPLRQESNPINRREEGLANGQLIIHRSGSRKGIMRIMGNLDPEKFLQISTNTFIFMLSWILINLK